MKPNRTRSGGGWGGGSAKMKIAQNVLKHILVLMFLKSDVYFSK